MVFAGGGTGGHVYPGLSVAAALRRVMPDAALLYIGRAGGPEERIVAGAGLRFHGIAAAGLRGKSPVAAAAAALKLTRGVWQSWRMLGRARPDAVFATGGYASAPVGVAARLRRVPLVVYLPDVHPGWAVRALSRIAARVATATEHALQHLPAGKTEVTGYPLRDAFSGLTRPQARLRLGLPETLPVGVPVLLVTGGSTGSRDLNAAVARHLPQFLALGYLIHISGPQSEAELRGLIDKLPPHLRGRYHLHGYLDDMPAAMVAADLGVMRAGASTLGELPVTGLPAVLVPGPFSDQQLNAAYLAEQGAATVLGNDDLDRLLPEVQAILTNPERLTAMRRAMSRLARPGAAERLARLVLEVAGRDLTPPPAGSEEV